MSTLDELAAEYDQLEAQAAELLDNDEAEADPKLAITRQLRATVKRHRAALERVHDEVREELKTERRTEAAWRDAGVPEAARALFGGIDPTDSGAVQARITELATYGVTWGNQPQAPAPPPPDPNLQAQLAMQAAAAGGATPGLEGDLATRMKKMEANPAAYSDRQHAAIVREYNTAVASAGRHGTSGARG